VQSSSRKSIGHLSIQSAPQAAAQTLREAIISGDLKGGDRILEQKWSVDLGIGQPTLREALRELEQQGLLRKLPQRGTYVAQLSPQDYRRIQEVRIPLEAIAIGRAAVRMTKAAERELTDIVRAMKGTGKELDVRHFHDCDVLFHRRIWELAENKYLQEMLEKITFRLFVFSVVGRWPNAPNAKSERLAAVRQHAGILKGLKSRDAETARCEFVRHTVEYWNRQYGLGLEEDEVMGRKTSVKKTNRPSMRKKMIAPGIVT
jgi:DNA-binding GntR family transcriptional regulator